MEQKIVNTTEFLRLDEKTQLLYFHLSAFAGADGFIHPVRLVAKRIGAGGTELRELLNARLLLPVDGGGIVVTDCRIWRYLSGIPVGMTETGIGLGKGTGEDSSPLAQNDERKQYAEEIAEVISYLNKAAGAKYSPKSAAAVKHISARLHDGHTMDDFKAVIDRKAREWVDTDMKKFLRPETLFGSKFETYLGAPQENEPQRDTSYDLEEFTALAIKRSELYQ